MRIRYKILFSLGAFLVPIVGIRPAWAVVVPFAEEPAAICTYGGGLVWDYELAAKFNPGKGRRITVMDICHSGGFVNNLASRPLSYVATACDWDEYSYTSVKFGQNFMKESKTHTLHDSFVTAASTALPMELPQEGGDLGGAELKYLSGDCGIIFSDSGHSNFWQGVTTAKDSLMTRPTLPWPDAAIAGFYGDGTTAGWGTATRENLLNAVDSARDSLGTLNNLFLYVDNHGASTDVVKSKHSGKDYEYQITTSIWRGWTDDNPYGISKLRHKLLDPAPEHYSAIFFDDPDWEGKVVGDWMEYYSKDPSNRDTWLTSGLDYDFGYTYYMDVEPGHVRWEDYDYTEVDPYDWGEPDGSAWGKGWVVYGQPTLGALDPSQWPGWENGGEGWVLAPTPAPGALVLGTIGLSFSGWLLRQRRMLLS